MRATNALLVGSLLTVLAGCGAEAPSRRSAQTPAGWGGEEQSYSTPGSAKAAESAPAPSSAGQPSGGGGWNIGGQTADAPPPPAPPPTVTAESSAGSSSHWNAPEPRPRERPGLGTEWGESRESHIREVSFFRADPERPFAVAQLFYNDRQGIEAMAAWKGGTQRFHDVPAFGGAITVSIRDAWGEPLDAMHVGDRTYVAGTEGERYAIVISNHTPRRFEAVATVDGLDVMNGKTGTFANRGYVLMPYASLEIDGFRQSEDVVAAFRFSKVRDSYAAQRGEARNVGVIGVAFFGERGDDWTAAELRTRDTASPFPNEGRFAPPPR
jgi:hypothetical protein